MVNLLCVALVLAGLAPFQSVSTDDSVQEEVFPGVRLTTFPGQPVDVTVLAFKDGEALNSVLPAGVEITNRDGKAIVSGDILFRFPDLVVDGHTIGIPMRFGLPLSQIDNPSKGIAALPPGGTLKVFMPMEKYRTLAGFLRNRGLSIDSVSRVSVFVTQLTFEDGSIFTPGGILRKRVRDASQRRSNARIVPVSQGECGSFTCGRYDRQGATICCGNEYPNYVAPTFGGTEPCTQRCFELDPCVDEYHYCAYDFLMPCNTPCPSTLRSL